MARGTVKWFNSEKGYGFIQVDQSDQDIFVHHTAIEATGFRLLKEGQRVEFEIASSPRGSQAEHVKVVG